MTKYISMAAIAAAALALGVSGASAYTENSQNLTVSANVINACSVTGATLNFGNVLATETNTTSAHADISVTCGGDFTIGLGNGQHYDSGKRNVYNGTDSIGYTLSDTDGGTTWTGGSIAGTGSPQNVRVFGILDAANGKSTGVHSDLVQITLTY